MATLLLILGLLFVRWGETIAQEVALGPRTKVVLLDTSGIFSLSYAIDVREDVDSNFYRTTFYCDVPHSRSVEFKPVKNGKVMVEVTNSVGKLVQRTDLENIISGKVEIVQ